MNFYSFPENHLSERYFLFKKGKNNVLVIGLNPSTNNAESLDPTSKDIEKIVKANGFDGWVIANLSPFKADNTSELPTYEDKDLLDKNLNLIEALIMGEKTKISNVILVWGDNLECFLYPYLPEYAFYLLERLDKYDLKFWCILKTRKGHPMHPHSFIHEKVSDKVMNDGLKVFHINPYKKMLKKKYIRPI